MDNDVDGDGAIMYSYYYNGLREDKESYNNFYQELVKKDVLVF